MSKEDIKALKELSSNREWSILFRLFNNLEDHCHNAFVNYKNINDVAELRGKLRNATYAKRIINTLYINDKDVDPNQLSLSNDNDTNSITLQKEIYNGNGRGEGGKGSDREFKFQSKY